jgi:hypothetical protein
VILIRFVDLKEENLEICVLIKVFLFFFNLRYAQHVLVFVIPILLVFVFNKMKTITSIGAIITHVRCQPIPKFKYQTIKTRKGQQMFKPAVIT